MKITQPVLAMAATVATLVLLASCQTRHPEKEVKQDCSGIFETRDANNTKIQATKKAVNDKNLESHATECKVLEVKFENNVTCEIVGSDSIDTLATRLEQDDKLILIAPESMVRDLLKEARKKLGGFSDMKIKYLESDVFKNLNFPYKGMRCTTAKNKFVVWSGDEKIILTVEKD